MKSWDIFCSVVDNYGDIGVTWRLARQLSSEYGQSVRLVVDDLNVFTHLCPEVDARLSTQEVMSVEIRSWTTNLQLEPADVVIEAFGCSLTHPYIELMSQRTPQSCWINLEYLSAEQWVEGCHLLPSPQLIGPRKVFFFPGFTNNTGGLLRENGLLEQRRDFDMDKQVRFLASLGVDRPEDGLLISLFCYDNPQIGTWLSAIDHGRQPVFLLVSPSQIERRICEWLGLSALEQGRVYRCASLTIQSIPFLPQADYDKLLWSCDINFVRGEDSFVRAQWAAKPFVWHIYPQDDDAHLPKISAFMERYVSELSQDASQALWAFWLDFNRLKPMGDSWARWLGHQSENALNAQAWCDEISAGKTLAKSLAEFTRNC